LAVKYYSCDMCGSRILPKDLRYVLKMNIFAAYDALEIDPSDLEKDYKDEIRRLIDEMENMDPKQLEEDVFKKFTFDVCRQCHKKFIKDPLGNRQKHEEPASTLPPFDVDEFLRRLSS